MDFSLHLLSYRLNYGDSVFMSQGRGQIFWITIFFGNQRTLLKMFHQKLTRFFGAVDFKFNFKQRIPQWSRKVGDLEIPVKSLKIPWPWGIKNQFQILRSS